MPEFEVTCPHCECELQVDGEFAGEEIECPECGEEFYFEAPKKRKIRRRKRPAPPGTARDSLAANDAVNKKAKRKGCLKAGLGCLGAFVLFVLFATGVMLVAHWHDKSVRNYGLKRLQQEKFDSPVDKEIAFALVEHYHNVASSGAEPEAMSKKDPIFLKTDKKLYYEILRKYIMQDLEGMKTQIPITKDNLVGEWGTPLYRERLSQELTKDGRYSGQVTNDYGEVYKFSGTWTIEGNTIVWVHDSDNQRDPNPILKLSKKYLVIREMSGELTIFKRLNMSSYDY